MNRYIGNLTRCENTNGVKVTLTFQTWDMETVDDIIRHLENMQAVFKLKGRATASTVVDYRESTQDDY